VSESLGPRPPRSTDEASETGPQPRPHRAGPQRLELDVRPLADFRYLIRRFLAASEALARSRGVTPQQHQALLAIAGCPATDEPTIGYLAKRLLVAHHSAVGLVDRLEQSGLVLREQHADRRQVALRLTDLGMQFLSDLSAAHRREIRQSAPRLVEALREIAQAAVPDPRPTDKGSGPVEANEREVLRGGLPRLGDGGSREQ
jgi:DNA-binding MarR family transcriptional regulator